MACRLSVLCGEHEAAADTLVPTSNAFRDSWTGWLCVVWIAFQSVPCVPSFSVQVRLTGSFFKRHAVPTDDDEMSRE